MENYPMFFPTSSSNNINTFLSSYPFPSNGSSFDGQSSNNGFLGLKTSTENNNEELQKRSEEADDKLSDQRGGSGKNNNTNKKSGKKVRKPRYAFQTRSQVDILDDGYRWRKYGQKAVKNNKFPRSYYRCTHQGCNVKKQVQRLTKDEGVVVTTYEGVHTHPIQKTSDNFEHILSQMQIYNPF